MNPPSFLRPRDTTENPILILALSESLGSQPRHAGEQPRSPGAGSDVSSCGEPQTYLFPGAGVRVHQGLVEVGAGAGLFRRLPNVYATKSCIAVLYGKLINASELVEGLLAAGDFRPGSYDEPSELAAAARPTPGGGGGLSSEGVDQGRLAAEVLLRLYLRQQQQDDDNMLLLLSELQVGGSGVVKFGRGSGRVLRPCPAPSPSSCCTFTRIDPDPSQRPAPGNRGSTRLSYTTPSGGRCSPRATPAAPSGCTTARSPPRMRRATAGRSR